MYFISFFYCQATFYIILVSNASLLIIPDKILGKLISYSWTDAKVWSQDEENLDFPRLDVTDNLYFLFSNSQSSFHLRYPPMFSMVCIHIFVYGNFENVLCTPF